MAPFCTVCKMKMPTSDVGSGSASSASSQGGRRRSKRMRFDGDVNGGGCDSDGEVALPPINEDGSSWAFTTERTSVSQMQIIFKLFDILKAEFVTGYLCAECLDYVDQIDSLQFQTQALIKAFKQRIDLHSDGCGGDEFGLCDDLAYDDDDREEPSQNAIAPIRTKSGRVVKRKNSSRAALKRKKVAAAENDSKEDSESATGIKVEGTPPPPPPATTEDEADTKAPRFTYKNEFWEKVNDPEYVEALLAQRDFDYDLSVVSTIHNTEHLVYDGCVWHPASSKEFKTDKYVAKWLCGKCHSFSYKCLARVATTSDNACVINVSKYMEHNHELDPEDVRNALFKNRVKEIAINHPEMTPIRVLKTVEMLNEDIGVKRDRLSHGCILKYISRVQEKNGIPRKPRERKPGYVPRKRKTPLLKANKTEVEEHRLVQHQSQPHEQPQLQPHQHQQNLVQEIVIVPQQGSQMAAQAIAAGTAAAYQTPTFHVEYVGHVVKGDQELPT